MHRSFRGLLALSAALATTACDSGGEVPDVDDPPPPPPTTVTYGETVVTAATRAFSDAEADAIVEVAGDRSRVVVTAAAFAADPVEVGDVIVAGPSEAAPDGLLRRVTAVANEGSSSVLTTAAASLEDVVVEGELQAEVALADGADPSYTFDLEGVVVADGDGDVSTQNDQGRLDGQVTISSPTLTLGALWTGGDAQEATVELTYRSSFDVDLSWGDVDGGEPVRLELGEYRLPAAVASIGASPVSVVVTPTLRVALVVSVPPAPSASESSVAYTLDASVSLSTGPASSLTTASALIWGGTSADLDPVDRLAPTFSQTTTAETELAALLFGEPFAQLLASNEAVTSVRPYDATWWSATGAGRAEGELVAMPLGRALTEGEASASSSSGIPLGRSDGPLPFDVPPLISAGPPPELTSNFGGDCPSTLPRWEVRFTFEDPNGDALSFTESVLHRWRNAGEAEFSSRLISSAQVGDWTPFEGELMIKLCSDFEGAESVVDEIQLLDGAGLLSNVLSYTRTNPD